MEVKQEETGHKGSFYVEQEGLRLAEMTYSWAGNDRIIIDHTEVSDKLRGMGVGLQLVEQAVAFAREKGISIIPLCPFARSVFNKKPDLKDVL
ncbi:GNAT family N-acetyltransferase [Marinoscillum sp. 108]|jgi:predicted GNAT family acetyltransferase|uniref:GNAT family N-acetyltransferase n=1 Tax=Marinoscillum sp. 108 TaxID=2653151 RepID=UPI0012F27097|nr:GNAT family N-acetyltransferase [Marinoscillum sp. 108]VXD13341.1 N-acetyltransferase [Marinoscillum sp. 108]